MREPLPITDLLAAVREERVDRHRRDPLRSVLVCSNLFATIGAFLWACWTSHDWIRLLDAAAAVLGILELARLLWFWHD